jgi:hypothetical protein
VPDPDVAERVAAAWQEAVAAAASLSSLDARAVAIGWATVELDRATEELAAALGLDSDASFRVAPRSDTLGATARIATGVLPGGGSLVALEPDTEGRLAASLARHDEGPVAIWLSVLPAAEPAVDASHAANRAVSPERDGPFGRERLIVGDPVDPPGRHRLLVARAAGTIPP